MLLGLFAMALQASQDLPPAPAWMHDPGESAVWRKPASYRDAIYQVPALARDLNAVAVGHAMAYEDMVSGRASRLESDTFGRIDWVLKHAPSYMPDEGSIEPTFVRRYGALTKLFDWAHELHAMTLDLLADGRLTDDQKDAELDALWTYYTTKAPFVVSGIPMNMEYLDSQSYSGAFRHKNPKVNGLFWGYHWLQGAAYDLMYRVPHSSIQAQYAVVGEQYHKTELYRKDRDFMPMVGEVSPRFAKRFPAMANAFDNLHMLHDNVNDILATPMPDAARDKEIERAILRVLATTHLHEESGSGEAIGLHDHRFTAGMPGMGYMKGSDENSMFMPGVGWMSMSDCAHCSVPLPDGPMWGATVSAADWSMSVRCLLCARDMAAQSPGRAIIRAATEDSNRTLVLISDEEGNWTSSEPNVVFLEDGDEHANCSTWSRAFTSRKALEAYKAKRPELAKAKPLSLAEWAKRDGGKPMTYRSIDKPNPYHKGGGN